MSKDKLDINLGFCTLEARGVLLVYVLKIGAGVFVLVAVCKIVGII